VKKKRKKAWKTEIGRERRKKYIKKEDRKVSKREGRR